MHVHKAEKDWWESVLKTSLKAGLEEFKICVAEKLLLVQILFEEVRFKAGREGL